MKNPQFEAYYQCYLDGSLSEAEQALFLAQLTDTERAEVIATRSALQALTALPQIEPPADLVTKVMTSIQPLRPPLWVTWQRWLAQHPVLGWQFAGMAIAGSVLFMALTPLLPTSEPGGIHAKAPSSRAQQAATHYPTPRAMTAGDNTVQLTKFTIYAPKARTVRLVGDFNSWGSESKILLKPQSNGVWTVDIPLPRGQHQYAFVVDDDKWVSDPQAAQQVDDDFGRKNAVLTVI